MVVGDNRVVRVGRRLERSGGVFMLVFIRVVWSRTSQGEVIGDKSVVGSTGSHPRLYRVGGVVCLFGFCSGGVRHMRRDDIQAPFKRRWIFGVNLAIEWLGVIGSGIGWFRGVQNVGASIYQVVS